MAKIAFKSDNQGQFQLLPPSLDELIPATHPVRVLNSIIDRLDVSRVLESYKGGGNSCFHPRMMLKVLIYAYLNNIYSSRKIALHLQEHIHYMWLSGGARPDFRTLNYFRGKRLKDSFDDIFTQVVELLHSEGFVSLEVQYIDGTKIESSANKYTFVWRGSVETYDSCLREKTLRILSEAERVLGMEIHETQVDEELSVEEFHARTSRVQEKMNSMEVPKKIKQAVEKTEKESIPKMLEYERALDIMDGRNSYSKRMRMPRSCA
ncbi:MAG: transposase [Culturomica sp.]|jgi:transposase|nr:transposase [Culturomica sp.]